MKYKRRVYEVEAFQLGVDEAPKWFQDKLENGTVRTYEGNSKYIGERPCHLIIADSGTIKAHDGDFIVRDKAGVIYPYDANHFNKIYELAKE